MLHGNGGGAFSDNFVYQKATNIRDKVIVFDIALNFNSEISPVYLMQLMIAELDKIAWRRVCSLLVKPPRTYFSSNVFART